jgi:hypothetical protein
MSFDSIATWVTLTLHLGIEQGVQRLLDGAPHHPLEVALDPLVVNRDDSESTSSSARFGTASPTLLRERFCTSFVRGRRTFFVLRRLVFEPPRFDVASEAASLAGEVTAALGGWSILSAIDLKLGDPGSCCSRHYRDSH